jgi:hypothetical protein
MPVPSNPQDLINIIREKLFNNTSGLIEEPDLREVLENIVKVLDAKFSMFSPNLTEEQFAQWNLILDYMAKETKGVLTTSSSAPTEKGKYLLASSGTYTNLGGLVTTADKLNYAYFDGTAWSLIAVDANNAKAVFDEEIQKLLSIKALFLGQKNRLWQPSTEQLNKAFFVLVKEVGIYSNLGNLELGNREYGLFLHELNSTGDSVWTKITIKTKEELMSTDGHLYLGQASTVGLPSSFIPYLKSFFSTRIAGTYPYHGGLVVNQGESAMLVYTPTSDTNGTWTKITIAKRGDIVVSASNASQVFKDLADIQATEALGIGFINQGFNLIQSGGRMILSDGTFATTNTSDLAQVVIPKNCEIIGQGISTIINSNYVGHDITIKSDNVQAIVRNVNVKHSIGLHRKATWEFYNSEIEQYNIWHDGVKADTDVPNFLYKNKYFSVGSFDTPAPFKYYSMNNAGSLAGSTSLVNQVTTTHAPAWNGNNLEARTVVLMPGSYVSNGGLQLRGDRGNRILGLPKYEKLVLVENPTGTLLEPNDAYMFATVSKVTTPQIIEGINFKRHINTKFALNMVVKNCYRNGVKLEDYNAESRVIKVGANNIHSKLDYAVRPMAFNATNADRWTIEVYGETRESTMITAYTTGYDIIGYNARVINIGIDMGQTAEQDSPTETLRVTTDFDGEIRDIEFVRAGVVRMYSKAAIIMLNQKKGRFINVKGTNLVMPGKRTTDSKMIATDIDGRLLNYVDNGDGTFTETEYSRFDGSVVGTATGTSAKTHTHYLPILKPESEIEKVGWEDYQGGRLYGIYIEVPTDADIEMTNCVGKGSPWGLHNTRGIYNNFGKVRFFNCVGYGGGIGHRLHGIICHRTSESELHNCIGYASPFGHNTPVNVHDRGNSCGIKFQMMSASTLIGCVGYGNEMQESHGIQADMRTQPKLINCIGYNGGGVNSAGLDISEYATIDVNGGYFGAHYKTSSFAFVKNHGNGMKMYPYKRPTRYGSNLDDVLYKNHWELNVDNTTQSYRLVNLTFTRSFQITSSGLGGVARVVVYKVNGSTKTEISRTILENIDGNYQYMNVPSNVIIDAQNGDYLYVALENASGVEYTTITNGFIEIAVNTTEVNEGLSGFYNQQLWSHETVIDPLNPQTNIVKNALINGVILEQETALRIGENAEIGAKYNVVHSTIVGDVETESGSEVVRVQNCVIL